MTIQMQYRHDDIDTTSAASGTDNAASARWFAFTDANEEEPAVRAHVEANLPATYEGLLFKDFTLKRSEDLENVWEIDVEYEHPSSPKVFATLEVDDVRWGIRTSGQATRKRLYSLGIKSETVDSATGDGYKLNISGREKFKDLVGLKLGGDGTTSVEGVDYSFSDIVITVETVKSASQISGGYLVTASDLAAKNVVNDSLWRGFAAGTLRLVDYSAIERSGADADWDINFTMIFSPNLTDIVVNSAITVPSKGGHDLLDVLYLPEKVPNGPFSVYRAVRAAVHQWYEESDFAADLGV